MNCKTWVHDPRKFKYLLLTYIPSHIFFTRAFLGEEGGTYFYSRAVFGLCKLLTCWGRMWWQFLKVSITNCIENTYCISTNPMASQESFWFSLLCTCFSLILYQMCFWYWKNHHLQLEKFWRYYREICIFWI